MRDRASASRVVEHGAQRKIFSTVFGTRNRARQTGTNSRRPQTVDQIVVGNQVSRPKPLSVSVCTRTHHQNRCQGIRSGADGGRQSNPPRPGSIRSSKKRSIFAVPLGPGCNRIAQSPDVGQHAVPHRKPSSRRTVRQVDADAIRHHQQ